MNDLKKRLKAKELNQEYRIINLKNFQNNLDNTSMYTAFTSQAAYGNLYEGFYRVKDEGPKIEDLHSQIIKKEEADTDTSLNFICVNSMMSHIDIRFSQQLASLEQYLQNFIDVEDFTISSDTLSDYEAKELVSEAKSNFKEWGIEIIRSLTEDFKKKALQHILPETYVIQLVETTKRRIFNSFKQLKKNLAEAVANSSARNFNDEKSEEKSRKKIGKKKSDFPNKARKLLKNWFIVHAQDPYPSHEEKIRLAREGGISMKQLENWLTNTRGRIWKKMQDEPRFDSEIEKVLLNTEENL